MNKVWSQEYSQHRPRSVNNATLSISTLNLLRGVNFNSDTTVVLAELERLVGHKKKLET